MPLPKISTPVHELELPSTGQTIKYRPFLVREEKLLILALESEDPKQITTAIKQVIKSCIQTKGVKVESLPTFDIEYLFLNIRGKSVGEEVELQLICPDDEETTVPVTILIDDIKVVKRDDHNNQIKINDELMMEMKYPSLDEFIKSNFEVGETNVDQSFDLVASCIDKVFSEEEVWTSADFTKKEIKEFLDQMNSSQFKEIESFFETIPSLTHTVNITNPKTKVKSKVTLEGLSNFFG